MRHLGLCLMTCVTTSLVAQSTDGGFRWVGLQGGSIAFDPASNVGSAPFLGGQFGSLLGARRYGFSVEFQQSRPESNLTPGLKLTHRTISATFLNGLSTDPASAWWPYVGVGLGALTYPRYDAAAHLQEARTAAAAHLSLGFLHRSGATWIWGAEARTRVAFTKQDMSETQVALLGGFSWGGARTQGKPPTPPSVVVTPTGTAPAPVPAPPPAPVVAPVPAAPPVPTPDPGSAAPVAPARVPVQPPAPAAVPAPAPIPAPVPVAPPEVAPAPVIAPTQPASAPKEAPQPKATGDRTARLAALRQGDMPRALELGRLYIRSLGDGRWTLRLEIANLPSTLKGAVEAYGTATPDLFIAPIRLRTGKTAYQLFLGSYGTKAEAEAAGRSVPAFFRDGGRPLPMLVGEIPSVVK
jgi:hypothetical protein